MAATSTAAPPPGGAGHYPREFVQQLVDRVACFSLLIVPDAGAGEADPAGGDLRGCGSVHPFAVTLCPPCQQAGVRAVNAAGEPVGRVRFRWAVIPHEFFALPDRDPPPVALDCGRSQRFAVREMELT